MLAMLCNCGCNKYSDKTERALMLAGDNRDALERVLEHYANEPQKLEAATFLIENMPGHYSYADTTGIGRYYRSMDSLLTVIPKDNFQNIIDAIDSLGQAYRWIDRTTIQDIQIITAEFLIANIDSAFSKWENTPWGNHLTFEQFCETILPYKTEELQPFDNWRAYMADSFPLDDTFRYCDQFGESPVQAALAIHNTVKARLNPVALAFPPPIAVRDIRVRMKIPYGVCSDYDAITTSVMRAHGIPVYNDFTPLWGYRNRLGHSWSALLHNNGMQIPYVGGMIAPNEAHKLDDRIAKAFRHTYVANEKITRLINSEKHIPRFFTNPFMQDVTPRYALCSDIEVDITDKTPRYAYLAIFNDASSWSVIDFAKIEHGKAAFKHLGRRCVYLPMAYDAAGVLRPIAAPIAIGIDGSVRSLIADPGVRKDMVLTRKYPALEYVYDVAKNIIGAEFQVAGKSDFSDAKTVYVISDGSPIAHEITLPDSIGPHRFWRYIQNEHETYCNIAEIAFYEPDSTTPVYGRIIGTDGYRWIFEDMTKDKVFDGDILTAFNAPIDSGAWVGMDFGAPKQLKRIRFTGRGDGNSIDSGHLYELLYWDNNSWASLGRKVATDTHLGYRNIPQNGLFLLRDLTKGKDERIFTYENGKQIWW